jgi:hypothetical protein
MPINIADEPPIPFTQIIGYVPRRRRGRKTSVSTVHRWATHGLRGVVLESIRVGESLPLSDGNVIGTTAEKTE